MALLVGSGTSLGGLTGGAAVARLLVVVSGNTSGLYESLGKATASLQGFRENAGVLGSALTRSLTLPILALGGIAINMASQFQTAMARVAGLTPVVEESGLSIEQLGSRIIEMSKRTGTSAVELANALYFAGSAGLDAHTALQVVELSAKGAAIGMGDAADISKVLIFALNNYASEGLTAASAMDTLTVAIREGTAEPNELAIALGRLIPIAKEAGISFGELVGSVAALTNLGVPTRVATTSLRALFSQLLAPTIQAKELLDQLGISAQELRDALAAGPVVAFDLLFEATGRNIDALHDIIPQIRAFTAFLGLTADEAARVTEIYRKTANSTGALQKAFAEISKTPAFKFQKALQVLSAAAIELGNKAMPVFLLVISAIRDVGEALESLPGPLQYAVLGFLGLAAALGPVLKLYDALTNAGTGLFSNTRSLITGLAVLGFTVGLASANFIDMQRGGANLLNTMGTLIGVFSAARLALGLMQAAALRGILGYNMLAIAMGTASRAALGLASLGLAALITGIAIAVSSGQRLHREMDQLSDSATSAGKAGESVTKWLRGLESEEAASRIRAVAASMNLLNKSVANALPQLTQGLGGQFVADIADLESRLRGAGFTDAANKLKPFVSVLDEAIRSGRDMGAALSDAGLSSQQFFDALDVPGGFPFQRAAIDARELALEVGHLQEAWREFNRDTQTAIAASLANETAIQSLADKYDVSVPFMQAQLDRYTSGVAVMDQQTETAFTHAAGIVDRKSGEMIGPMAEAQQAAEALAAEISGNLRDSFTLFGELPEKFGANMDKLLSRADQLSDIAVQQAQDVRTLFERGVPSGLIEDILAQGPNAVKRFADATKPELRKLVTAYQVGLGAMDDAILAETVHQEGKGASMVERFTTAILRRKTLPQAAAGEIVRIMTTAFASGKVGPAALDLVTDFANAVAAQGGMSRAAAGKLVTAVARRLAQGKGIPEAGTDQGRDFARAIADTADISFSAAVELMNRVQSGIESRKAAVRGTSQRAAFEAAQAMRGGNQIAFSAGTGLTNALAAGIRSVAASAAAAARAVAQQTADSFSSGFYGSPKFFSYYLGQDIVKQFDEGLRKAGAGDVRIRASKVLARPSARIPASLLDARRGDDRGRSRKVDVFIDRRRWVEQSEYEVKYGGGR